ncbi:DUF1461 domain-containing protein [Candidatus Woesearchaeota archaeon]|nr:DUF1461 domain-containing protein [Candidatus Woesearchaeota archaeon]
MSHNIIGGEGERKALLVISTILIAYIVLAASFFIVLFDHGFYDRSYDKYGTYKELGVEGIRQITDNLINYLISENTEINKIPALITFTADERSHLVDVRNLIRRGKHIALLCLLGLAAIILRLRAKGWLAEDWRKMLRYGGYAVAAMLIALFSMSYLGFDSAFGSFHQAFFPQGNYMFPSDSLIKTMFPDEFFRDFAVRMGFHILVMGLILYFLGSRFALGRTKPEEGKKRKKKKREKIMERR